MTVQGFGVQRPPAPSFRTLTTRAPPPPPPVVSVPVSHSRSSTEALTAAPATVPQQPEQDHRTLYVPPQSHTNATNTGAETDVPTLSPTFRASGRGTSRHDSFSSTQRPQSARLPSRDFTDAGATYAGSNTRDTSSMNNEAMSQTRIHAATARQRPSTACVGGREQSNRLLDPYATTSSLANERAASAWRQTQAKTATPAYVRLERQVLRFFGYLAEPNQHQLAIGDKAVVHCRPIVLFYFVEDSSIEVVEQRQQNSGLRGGLLLRRNMFLRRDGKPHTPGDIRVGGRLRLAGATYHLLDCDESTRKFYADLGDEQPEKVPPPVEPPLTITDTTGLGAGVAASELVGRRTGPSLSPQKGRRYGTNASRVLRFDAIWDDPAPGGQRRKYHLLHFLEDGTCELRSSKEDLDAGGLDEGPVYLRRQRLPCDWRSSTGTFSGDLTKAPSATVPSRTGRSSTSSGGFFALGGQEEAGESEFISEMDLCVGGSVEVWGRTLRLVSCDAFTRQHYLEKHGRVMPQADEALDALEDERQKMLRETKMAGTDAVGWLSPKRQTSSRRQGQWLTGAVETGASSQQVLSGLGKAEEDTKAWKNQQGIQGGLGRAKFGGRRLRCKCRMLPKDADSREFILTYNLADDTLSVFEVRQRNSGRSGGAYLVKGRYQRPVDTIPQSTMLASGTQERSRTGVQLNSTFGQPVGGLSSTMKDRRQDPSSTSTPRSEAGGGGGRFFVPQDIYIGAILPLVTGAVVEVVEMDLATLSLLEEFPADFPMSDYSAVVSKVAKNSITAAASARLTDETNERRRDGLQATNLRTAGGGHVPLKKDAFLSLLQKMKLAKGLCKHEVMTLVRRFQLPDDRILWDEMCDTLSLHLPYNPNDENLDKTSNINALGQQQPNANSDLLKRIRESASSVRWRRLFYLEDAQAAKSRAEHQATLASQTASHNNRSGYTLQPSSNEFGGTYSGSTGWSQRTRSGSSVIASTPETWSQTMGLQSKPRNSAESGFSSTQMSSTQQPRSAHLGISGSIEIEPVPNFEGSGLLGLATVSRVLRDAGIMMSTQDVALLLSARFSSSIEQQTTDINMYTNVDNTMNKREVGGQGGGRNTGANNNAPVKFVLYHTLLDAVFPCIPEDTTAHTKDDYVYDEQEEEEWGVEYEEGDCSFQGLNWG